MPLNRRGIECRRLKTGHFVFVLWLLGTCQITYYMCNSMSFPLLSGANLTLWCLCSGLYHVLASIVNLCQKGQLLLLEPVQPLCLIFREQTHLVSFDQWHMLVLLHGNLFHLILEEFGTLNLSKNVPVSYSVRNSER